MVGAGGMRASGRLMSVRTWLPLAALLAAVSASPAGASVSSQDLTASQAYVRAEYSLVRTVDGHLARSQAALMGLRSEVRRDCPLGAAGSPQDPQSTQLSNELIGVMVLSAGRPDLQAIRVFTRAVSRLRWSNRRLTGAVHTYAGKLHVLAGLTAPALCADIKAWAASGFTALPSSTIRFAGTFMANWVAAGELPSELAAYEDPGTRSLAARASALESPVSEFEVHAVETWAEIMNALDLWP